MGKIMKSVLFVFLLFVGSYALNMRANLRKDFAMGEPLDQPENFDTLQNRPGQAVDQENKKVHPFQKIDEIRDIHQDEDHTEPQAIDDNKGTNPGHKIIPDKKFILK